MSYEDVTELALQGDPEAIHALCYRYSYGYDGAAKDYDKAFDWCQKSAMNVNSSSITLLAELFYMGRGTEQNYEAAFQLYNVAAELGHNHAQLMLYIMHYQGKGTKKDKGLANYWLTKSAHNGNKQALRLIGKTST